MVEAITQETAEKVVDALCERVGALRIKKTGTAWSALGLLFDGLKLVGLAVPSGRQVVQEYAQTVPILPGVKTPVSTAVLLPDRELAPDNLCELFVHECTHSQQSNGDAAWGVKYLQYREYRAGTSEAPAFAAAVAFRWALTGRVPESLDGFVSVLREGYDAQDHALVAHDVIEMRATEVSMGVIRSELARLAIAIVYREQPLAIHPEARVLLEANCPQALVVS